MRTGSFPTNAAGLSSPRLLPRTGPGWAEGVSVTTVGGDRAGDARPAGMGLILVPGMPVRCVSRVGERHRDRGGLLGYPDQAGRLGSLAGELSAASSDTPGGHPSRQRP
jgi:hypothetical protein